MVFVFFLSLSLSLSLSLTELGFLRKVSLLFWQAQIHFDKLINNFNCYSILSTVKMLINKTYMYMMMMITIIIIIIIIIILIIKIRIMIIIIK